MFPWHLIGMLRMCGALSIPIPPIPTVLVNNIMPAALGTLDVHNSLGPIISGISNIRVGQSLLAAAPSIMSMAAPDILGIIPHVQGLPIPIQGSQNVFLGLLGANGIGDLGQLTGNLSNMAGLNGLGSITSLGAGLGMMQPIFGAFGSVIGFQGLNIGEMIGLGSQIVGQVAGFTRVGGGGALAQIANPTGPVIYPGQVVVGQSSGVHFTFNNFFDTRTIVTDALHNVKTNNPTVDVSTQEAKMLPVPVTNPYPNVNDASDALVTDDGEYIVLDSYFDLYPTINLTSAVISQ
jgi:hypothetical protein